MRTTRNELKSLIKECLVEILAEGLGTTLQNESKINKPTQNTNFLTKPVPSKISTDLTQRRPTPQLKEAIKREAGGNKVMESILADTAATTLVKQIEHGDTSPTSGGRHMTQQEQINGTPEQVFGEEATSRWANLAFMDSTTKK